MSIPGEVEVRRTLLLGETESRYGEIRSEILSGGQTACVLSVGADPDSPAMAFKGRVQEPNEDALFALDDGETALLAVADAHFGGFASHVLLRRLADLVTEAPPSPADLVRVLRMLGREEPTGGLRSETSLVLTVLRRDIGAGFGFSFGDSTCALLGGRHRAQPLNRKTANYVSPAQPMGLSPENGSFFEFDVREGALVLAFTDGIDGCHYRSPETSVQPEDIAALFEEVGPKPEPFASKLAQMALEGVRGNPGGQDNIALVVTAV